MNKYFKHIFIILFICFIVPQIALASWWNPLSWNIWNNIFGISHKPKTTITIPENNPINTGNVPIDTDVKQIPSPVQTCNPNWKCETWSLCKNSLQTRACVDANSCGVLTGKPSIAQSCTVSCSPNWQCSNWSVCSSSIQTRTCADSNGCGNNTTEPASSQPCSMPQTTSNQPNPNLPINGSTTGATVGSINSLNNSNVISNSPLSATCTRKCHKDGTNDGYPVCSTSKSCNPYFYPPRCNMSDSSPSYYFIVSVSGGDGNYAYSWYAGGQNCSNTSDNDQPYCSVSLGPQSLSGASQSSVHITVRDSSAGQFVTAQCSFSNSN